MSLLEHINSFLADIRGLAATTRKRYALILSRYREWPERSGGWPAQEDIARFCAYVGEKYGPSSGALAGKVMQRFVRWGAAQGLIVMPANADSSRRVLPVWLKPFAIYLEHTKSPRTRSAYLSAVMHFARWYENYYREDCEPAAVTVYDLYDYRGHLIAVGASPATINARLMGLRCFFKYAVKEKLVPHNPFADAEAMTVPANAPQPRWLEQADQAYLVKKVRHGKAHGGASVRDLAVILTMLDAGLRVQEVCNLKATDVILTPAKDAVLQVKYTKGYKCRTVPIVSKRLLDALKHYQNVRPTAVYFFVSARGEQLTPRGVQHIVEKYKDDRLKNLSGHRLRHSFCKNLADKGLDNQQIAMLAGHVRKDGQPNLQTVAIYTRPAMTEIRDALQRAQNT